MRTGRPRAGARCDGSPDFTSTTTPGTAGARSAELDVEHAGAHAVAVGELQLSHGSAPAAPRRCRCPTRPPRPRRRAAPGRPPALRCRPGRARPARRGRRPPRAWRRGRPAARGRGRPRAGARRRGPARCRPGPRRCRYIDPGRTEAGQRAALAARQVGQATLGQSERAAGRPIERRPDRGERIARGPLQLVAQRDQVVGPTGRIVGEGLEPGSDGHRHIVPDGPDIPRRLRRQQVNDG